MSLVKGLVFVVLSQPISTHCTIVSDIHDKVVGKPALGKTKAKAGQGDFQSIVFWTNKQAQIMLCDIYSVFFIGPWSIGKTLLMREKAVMWARENRAEKLVFVVVRDENASRTSLLEIELRFFFRDQHNLPNIEVLGLPSFPKNTLTILLKEATKRSASSWMVDELIMPHPKYHQQWAQDLQKLQNLAQPHLWIACAGIIDGKHEHFKRSYLTSVLPSDFHIPEMDMPLRNTKETLAMAGLESNTQVKSLAFGALSTKTNPVYKIPKQLIAGVKGNEFLVNNVNDHDELARVVEVACQEVLRRTGGTGFPVLSNVFDDSKISTVMRDLHRAGASALVYVPNTKHCCTETEVEEWLRERRDVFLQIRSSAGAGRPVTPWSLVSMGSGRTLS